MAVKVLIISQSVWLFSCGGLDFFSDLPLTPIVEGFVILKKNPDYDES